MNVLLDNDAMLKICRYDLQDIVASHFGGHDRLRVLETAPYSLHVQNEERAIKLTGSREALQRLRSFIHDVPVLEISPNNEHLATLAAAAQVDAGEVILFAAAADDSKSIVFSGDKRAIRGLARAAEALEVRQALAGRIKCMEQVIAELIEAVGYDAINQRIQTDLDADTTMRVCFSSGKPKSTLQGLRSYYDDLNKAAPDLLAQPPGILT